MIDITDFAKYKDGDDWTPALDRALANAGDGIFFPAGTYHFYPEHLAQEYCFFSNNDEGLKRIVFNLRNRAEFTLSGDRAEFIFHGRTVPFRCKNVSGLKISGIRIDFDRSFIVRARVAETSPGGMVLAFPPEQFYRIVDGKICFIDDEYKFISEHIGFMTYDPERRMPPADGAVGSCPVAAEETGRRLVRFRNCVCRAGVDPPRPGDTLVMKPEPRLCPGVVLDECTDVTLEELTIHHCGGMAVLAQNCRNLTLNKVTVALRENSDRLISAADDAAHFVQCSGFIRLSGCRFENQWDDAVNIHGIYQTYVNRLGHMLRTGHYQQLGIPAVRPGETLLFGDLPVKIREVLPGNKQYAIIVPESPIPDTVSSGTSVLNADRQPDVDIRDCVFRNNFPRGVLVSSGGRVVIENNYFRTPGAAVCIAGDDIFWYESGPARSVVIRGNTFDACLYHRGCRREGVIDIHPEISSGGSFYHHNIVIEQNRFTDAHRRQLYAEDTDNIVFAHNSWKISGVSPEELAACPVHFSNCGHAVVTGNGYDPAVPHDFHEASSSPV